MSSGAEAVNAGVVPAEENEAQATAGALERAKTPDRAADTEIPLRSMAIYLPETPVNINGHPYQVILDEARLVKAVNIAAESGPAGSKNLNPKQLVISYGETLPSQLAELDAIDQQPLLMLHNEGGSAIHIIIPGEVAKSSVTPNDLASLIAQSANRDLLTAIGQTIKAKSKLGISLRLTSAAVSMATGEGVGIATAENATAMLWRGSIGALVGGAAMIAVLLANDTAQKSGGDWSNWAVKKSRRKVKKPDYYFGLQEMYEREPIISLHTLEAEDNPA